jgi:tetratricopeptide (TPR) repeat protein
MAKAQPKVALYRSNLAVIYGRIAGVRSDTGKTAEALAALAEAGRLQRGLVDAEPGVPRYRSDLAWTENLVGNILAWTGRNAEALAAFGRARELRRALAEAHPGVPDYRADLALTLVDLGRLLSDSGREAEGRAACAEAVAALEQLAGANPAAPRFRDALATALDAHGGMLAATGPVGQARALHDRARALRAALAEAHRDVPRYRTLLAASDDALAGLDAREKKFAAALDRFDALLRTRAAQAEASPALVELRVYLAEGLDHQAEALLDAGRAGPAEAARARARELWEDLAVECPTVVDVRRGLVRNLAGLGDAVDRSGSDRGNEAGTLYRKALALAASQAVKFPEAADLVAESAACDERLGALAARVGRAADAAVQFRRSAATLDALLRPRAGDLYALARARARLAGPGLPRDPTAPARVLAALRRALDAGFRDPARLAADPAFDSFRALPAFRALALDAAFPTDPFIY